MKKIIIWVKAWIKTHKELSAYVFFGILTTVISFVSYFAFRQIFPDKDSVPRFLRWTFSLTGVFGANSNTSLPVFLSWIITVTFAYFTNRKWVFKSHTRGFLSVGAEILAFYGGRIFTLFVDMLIMFLLVDLPKVINPFVELGVKIFANAVVLILNYIISKIIVFKKSLTSEKK